MKNDEFDQIRDKDHTVLQHIQEGEEDVQKITAATTLENHHVNYAFEKLEEDGLLDVSKPDGTVERIIDGQKRVFQHPKQADLTGKGEEYLEHAEREDLDEYENLSHGELVEKIHRLEDKIDQLESSLEAFRRQVRERL